MTICKVTTTVYNFLFQEVIQFEKYSMPSHGKEWEYLTCPEGKFGQKYFAGNNIKKSVGNVYHESRF